MYLYQQTQSVIRNPEHYESLGRPRSLTSADCTFMIQLVHDEPNLFLDEILEQLYDSGGTLLSVESVYENLFNHLSITLKKAETLNSRKFLVKKFKYIEAMDSYPADFLVFTGLSFPLDLLYHVHLQL